MRAWALLDAPAQAPGATPPRDGRPAGSGGGGRLPLLPGDREGGAVARQSSRNRIGDRDGDGEAAVEEAGAAAAAGERQRRGGPGGVRDRPHMAVGGCARAAEADPAEVGQRKRRATERGAQRRRLRDPLGRSQVGRCHRQLLGERRSCSRVRDLDGHRQSVDGHGRRDCVRQCTTKYISRPTFESVAGFCMLIRPL